MITRPENDFRVLPSDLVFCAIPFSTSCYKKDSSPPNPYEIINIVPLTEEMLTDIDCPPPVEQVNKRTAQPLSKSAHSLEPRTMPTGDSKAAVLAQSLSSKTLPGGTGKDNGRENMEEATAAHASVHPESNRTY